MTGSDPHEIAARLPRHAKDPDHERFLAQFNDWIAGLPIDTAAAEGHDQLPLVYIVGAPRSGTTLASQLISKYLEVGYINNLIARFWRRPLAGIRLSDVCLGSDARREIVLQSSHGVSSGIVGPHEFGYFWRFWLGLDSAATHHLSAAESERVDVAGLGRVLRDELLGGFRRPTVFKNVICGFQAPLLSRVHPRSLFVHVTRDLTATAASILTARQARLGDVRSWWSLKPSTFDEIRRLEHPAEQVVRQVRDCRAEFSAAFAAPGVHHIELAYESMCRSPREELERLCAALRPLGADLQPAAEIEPLSASAGPQLPPDLHDALLRLA
jgi:hypothetical protein